MQDANACSGQKCSKQSMLFVHENWTHTNLYEQVALQHTATHRNPRQHTATHCNTLHHTATHCSTLHAY